MINSKTLHALKKYTSDTPHQRDDSFCHSAVYYALTGRRGAWICQSKNTKAVICHHPNRDHHLLIFPEIGNQATNENGKLIADIVSHLPLTQHTIQLCRFTADDIGAVQHHLGSTSPLKITKQIEPTLDWQYPIHILDTAAVAGLIGSSFRNVRQKVKQLDTNKIETIPLSDDRAFPYLRACTKYWEGNQILYNKDHHPSDGAFYDTLFSLLQTHPDLCDGFILKYGNRICGFSIWDKTKGDTANLIANLVDIHVTGLSEYQLVTTCRRLHKQGIRFLNRGGSERKGLDNFKQKFAPVKSITLYSARVEQAKIPQMSVLPLVETNIFTPLSTFS